MCQKSVSCLPPSGQNSSSCSFDTDRTLPVTFQEDPHLQGGSGLFERGLRGGGGPREGPQRLPPPPQHRDVPHQAAGGESAHPAGGHHEGGGQLGRPAGQQHHLQRGVLEPRAAVRQHRGEAERKSRRCSRFESCCITLWKHVCLHNSLCI